MKRRYVAHALSLVASMLALSGCETFNSAILAREEPDEQPITAAPPKENAVEEPAFLDLAVTAASPATSPAEALGASNSYADEHPTAPSTVPRAADARSGDVSFTRGICMPALPRTSLAGNVAAGTVVDRGLVRQTLDANTLLVNPGPIVSGRPGASDAVLEARCRRMGGSIVLRDHTIINNLRVMSCIDNATTTTVQERCAGRAHLTVSPAISRNTLVSNGGQVKAVQ